MASIRRKCLNSPNSFCYVGGNFTVPSQRMSISKFVKSAYSAYFKIKMTGCPATTPSKIIKKKNMSQKMTKNGSLLPKNDKKQYFLTAFSWLCKYNSYICVIIYYYTKKILATT